MSQQTKSSGESVPVRQLLRPCILNIMPYKPGKPVEELRRELNIRHVYKMASNENALGPSPKAVAAVKKALAEVNRYPDGNCFYLKKALAKKYKIAPEQIVVGNGSDEIITLAARAFINRGDEVIISSPTFLIYKIASLLSEASVISVPMRAYRYCLPAMLEKITPRTKIIFIANPDNPSGTYVTRLEVEEFLRRAGKHVIIYFDEAYFEYVDAKDYPDTLNYLRRGNVITSRSFSKIYGLGGLRVGWAAAGREIAGYLNVVREPFNVNRPAQEAAAAALEDGRYVEKSKKLVREGMKYLGAQFRALNLFFVPSVTNFMLVNVGRHSQHVHQRLLEKGIIVREMSDWGLKNFIRVTIGTDRENRLFIRELTKILLTRGRK